MKTPITYYGGKQSMAKLILSLLPQHKIYCEPFFGGGAVFFAKGRGSAKVEVINDSNHLVIDFFEVLKHHFKALKRLIEITLHSRYLYLKSKKIYRNPSKHNKIWRAWAFWVQSNMSFACKCDGNWGYCRNGKRTLSLYNKRLNLTEHYQKRLELTTIECTDALKVIQIWDTADTFFYIDPPYFSADMGHYKGYTEDDFAQLLNTLTQIKGKFLLSSYPESILMEYRKKYAWKSNDVQKMLSMGKIGASRRTKTECLTYNYDV